MITVVEVIFSQWRVTMVTYLKPDVMLTGRQCRQRLKHGRVNDGVSADLMTIKRRKPEA